MNEQSILESYREREKQIRREMEEFDRSMSKRQKEQERIRDDAAAKITRERATLARLKADYMKLESELEAKAKAELEASGLTIERVKDGSATLREFFDHGLSVEALKRQAHEEVRAKLDAALSLIRSKAVEILRLELIEAEARRAAVQAAALPRQSQSKLLRAEADTIDRVTGEILLDSYKAEADVQRLTLDVCHAEEKGISPIVWDTLSLDQIRDLKFDPRINPKHLEDLAAFLEKASPDVRYNVTLIPRSHVPGQSEGMGFNAELLK